MFIFKKLFIVILTISLASCTFNKIDNVHGVPNLKNKSKLLKINQSNKNDIVSLLGPAPLKNDDEKKWTYFEVRETKSRYGKEIIYVNDYIEFYFNKYGVINKMELYDLKSMNKVTFTKEITKSMGVKDSFSKNLFRSTRKRMENLKNKNKN